MLKINLCLVPGYRKPITSVISCLRMPGSDILHCILHPLCVQMSFLYLLKFKNDFASYNQSSLKLLNQSQNKTKMVIMPSKFIPVLQWSCITRKKIISYIDKVDKKLLMLRGIILHIIIHFSI